MGANLHSKDYDTCIACGQIRPMRYYLPAPHDAPRRAVLMSDGRATAYDSRTTKGVGMFKRLSLMVAAVSVIALMVVSVAAAQTVPTVPVAAYGGTLLTELGDAIEAVLPYAAAITAFAIGVGMLRRWLGHRRASQV